MSQEDQVLIDKAFEKLYQEERRVGQHSRPHTAIRSSLSSGLITHLEKLDS